jgi:hypothetical protein
MLDLNSKTPDLVLAWDIIVIFTNNLNEFWDFKTMVPTCGCWFTQGVSQTLLDTHLTISSLKIIKNIKIKIKIHTTKSSNFHFPRPL